MAFLSVFGMTNIILFAKINHFKEGEKNIFVK